MALISVLGNIRYWVLAGAIIGLLGGDLLGSKSGDFLTFTLVLLMCFSLTGLRFNKDDVKENKRTILISTIVGVFISPIVTLIIGSLFDDIYWEGWVLLACVPCAIAVISGALLMGADTKLMTLSVTAIYIVAIIFTPVTVALLTGGSVDPLTILKYVLLFILVPMIISLPLGKMRIPKSVNTIVINFCFLAMVLVAFGKCRDTMISDPMTVLLIAVACFIRVPVIHLVSEMVLRKAKVPVEKRIHYILLLGWKNSGMSLALCITLVPDSSAVLLPGSISLVFELTYMMFMMWYYSRLRKEDSIVVESSC